MITCADVEKLLATRSEDPPVLSLYLEVPLDLPALRGLPARAAELVNSAAGGPCGPDGPDAERALTEARQAVRRFLEDSAPDWLGHCVAIFICGPAGLAEAIPLPAGLGEQRLGVNAQLACHPGQLPVPLPVPLPDLQHHLHRAFAELLGVLPLCRHDSASSQESEPPRFPGRST